MCVVYLVSCICRSLYLLAAAAGNCICKAHKAACSLSISEVMLSLPLPECNAISERETDTRWSRAYGSFLSNTNGTVHMILFKLIIFLKELVLKNLKRKVYKECRECSTTVESDFNCCLALFFVYLSENH